MRVIYAHNRYLCIKKLLNHLRRNLIFLLFVRFIYSADTLRTLEALKPRSDCSTSNSTESPSAAVL